MIDFRGEELNPGDEVFFIYKGGCGSINLMEGKIKEIKHGTAYVFPKFDKEYSTFARGVKSVSIVKKTSYPCSNCPLKENIKGQ